ncbi:hypothetical protein E1B28_000031 [Marasmius oreades]|uniref:Uncharacterized protein n=1 Tax=Marasmius oreades TaxID=181124 RepID=A0A9P7V0L5_9AGAR|nr:uncharacterized protein E1B28_000031 [Marasmius oreades]KAG7098057.1 hypothetical protein E1B28_000031 [Marasmius oreades]
MSSTLEQILATFLNANSILTRTISTLSVLFFIYGFYCFIFGLSIHVLFHQSNPVHRLQTGCTIALFILATIYIVSQVWATFGQASIGFHAATTKDYASVIQYLKGDDGKIAWVGTLDIVSNLMNSIADIMLIHRCYRIFNSNKLVLFTLGFSACILNGIDLGCIIAITIGYGSSSKPDNPNLIMKVQSIDNGVVIGIAIFQTILTFLTGGRIWWITHQARKLMGGSTCTRYNNIIAIIIESGLLNAGFLLTEAVVEPILDSGGISNAPIDFTIFPVLMSGLSPTMVIAWVAYGKSVESVQQAISMHHRSNTETSHLRSATGIRQATIDLESQTQAGITISDL